MASTTQTPSSRRWISRWSEIHRRTHGSPRGLGHRPRSTSHGLRACPQWNSPSRRTSLETGAVRAISASDFFLCPQMGPSAWGPKSSAALERSTASVMARQDAILTLPSAKRFPRMRWLTSRHRRVASEPSLARMLPQITMPLPHHGHGHVSTHLQTEMDGQTDGRAGERRDGQARQASRHADNVMCVCTDACSRNRCKCGHEPRTCRHNTDAREVSIQACFKTPTHPTRFQGRRARDPPALGDAARAVRETKPPSATSRGRALTCASTSAMTPPHLSTGRKTS